MVSKLRVLFLLMLPCMLAFSGCGSSTPSGTSNGGTGTPAAGGSDASLQNVKSAGVIKWGADDSGGAPFVFTNPDDPSKIIGFEVDIMEKVAEHMGVKQEIVKGQWDTLPANLLAGRSDIVMNGLEINEERKKKVGFSKPYFLYEQQLAIRSADKDKYKSLADLKGKKIGTLSGAEANNVLKAAGFTEDQIVPHDDSYTPYRNLELERVDAVLQENVIANHYAAPAKMPKLYLIPETFAPGEYAVATRPGDKALLAEIDRVLDLMKKNGELAEIYKKWNIWTPKQSTIGVEEKK
jgi:polar amino acid transport system substrate-binding protein